MHTAARLQAVPANVSAQSARDKYSPYLGRMEGTAAGKRSPPKVLSQNGPSPHTSHLSALRPHEISRAFFFLPHTENPKTKKSKKIPINCPPVRARAKESDSAAKRDDPRQRHPPAPPWTLLLFPSIRTRNDRHNVFVTCSSHAPLAGSAPACFPP